MNIGGFIIFVVLDALGAIGVGAGLYVLVFEKKPFGIRRIIASWAPTVHRTKKLAKARAKADRKRRLAEREARDQRKRVYEEAQEAKRQWVQNNMVRRQEARNRWIQDYIDAGGTNKELGIKPAPDKPKLPPLPPRPPKMKVDPKVFREYGNFYEIEGETLLYNPRTGEWRG